MNEEKLIYCKNCGYTNAENAKFCSGCGKPLFENDVLPEEPEVVEAEVVEAEVVENEPTVGTIPGAGEEPFSYVDPDDNGINREKHQQSFEDLKQICGSGPAFLLTLLMTASIALTIYMSLSSPLAAIVALIPTIIITIGCWITWISSKAGRPATGGFTLMSGVMIFYIIITIIAFVAVAIVYVFAFIKGSPDQYTNFIVSAVITAITFFLIFLSYKKIRKTITRARGIIRNEEDTWFSSAYIRFLLWVSLILSILGAIGLVFVKFTLPVEQFTSQFQQSMNMLQNVQGLSIPIPQQLLSMIPQLFTMLTSWAIVADTVIGVLIALFALILMKKIRKSVKAVKAL